MSFTIVRTNGTVLTVIPDGELNTTSTPLFLPGRNYPGYGSVIDTNFVRQLENFAFGVPPSNALQGQLWYNTNLGEEGLYVCPIDGESNPSNWIKLYSLGDVNADLVANSLTLTGDIVANNAAIANTVTANLVDTDYLTVNIQANIANANVTGNTVVANLQTANITTGSNTTAGSLTGAWSLNGNLTSNGNITSLGFVSGNYRYANGQLINFDKAAGSNSQVQYNLNGNLAASSKLTFSDSGSLLSVDGSIVSINFEALPGGVFAGDGAGLSNIPAANLAGVLSSAIQSNITQLGALSSLTVTGAINAANVFAANTVSATRLSGSLITAAQPNVTSVGTLTSLAVSGGITSTNIYSQFYGDGGNISNIQGASVDGEVSFAAVANSVAVANVSGIGNVALLNRDGNASNILYGNGVFAAAPTLPPSGYGNSNVAAFLASYGSNTISTTGNITAGNMSGGNLVSANFITGTLTTAAQPNVTSLGVLTGLTVLGNINSANVFGNHFGNGAGLTNINGSNVTGTVANAAYAANAGNATLAANATFAANAGYANNAGNATFATTAGSVSFMPSGTRMIFAQATAPTGWTKQTTNDNAALRVVSGSSGGSSGGTVDFTTAFTSRSVSGTTANTILSASQMPVHSHLVATNIKVNSGNAAPFGPSTYLARETDIGGDTEYNLQATYSAPNSLLTSTAGNGEGHNHTFNTSLDFAVKYVDVIIAQKN